MLMGLHLGVVDISHIAEGPLTLPHYIVHVRVRVRVIILCLLAPEDVHGQPFSFYNIFASRSDQSAITIMRDSQLQIRALS